jgi:peptidoglycan/xylan/chitin deacetylase (PgdA/CDA1 family)
MERIAALMYHEIELPGRALCEAEPGYVRYAVTEPDFRAHVDALKAGGFLGVSVGEMIAQARVSSGRSVAVTFDDGCETDLLVALPVLRTAGFNATSYVTVEHLGRRGYLTAAQLRELADLGCEIGSHGMTHRFLSDLSADEIRSELAGSKDRLEQIVQRPVVHFSCPGGRWDGRVADAGRDAGYASVATSRVGTNSPPFERYALARVAIMRGASARDVLGVARAEGLAARRARGAVLGFTKRLLGNGAYQGLRSLWLGRSGERAE